MLKKKKDLVPYMQIGHEELVKQEEETLKE